MTDSIQRYKNWYAKLLRLYSKPYYERFGKSMEQTFNDLLRERTQDRGLPFCAVWMFGETSVGIMRENLTTVVMRNKNMLRIALATALLLLVPFLAMQFTDEVKWTLFDFAVAGALLFGTGLTYELIATRGSTTAYRAAVGLAVAIGLILVWLNLAVGIIGREDSPANLMYFGVLAVGIIGAIIGRLQPPGMARALFATALAQMSVPVLAMIFCKPALTLEPPGVLGVFVLNAFFGILFVFSALLFRRACAH